MKLTEIQELIRFVSKSGVSEVEIEQKDFKISIKTENKKRPIEAQYVQQPLPFLIFKLRFLRLSLLFNLR